MQRLFALMIAAALGLAPLSASSVHALDAKQRAPQLSMVDLSGKKIDLASLRGKVGVVDFWASWCGPCKVEMPVLDRLYKEHRSKGLVVIGVSVDRERENVTDFLKKMKVAFPIVHDKDHSVSGAFKPPKMPSSYVIDRKGIVRHVHEGFRKDKDEPALEREIRTLLDEG
jgi:peroxiredoxin